MPGFLLLKVVFKKKRIKWSSEQFSKLIMSPRSSKLHLGYISDRKLILGKRDSLSGLRNVSNITTSCVNISGLYVTFKTKQKEQS